MQHDMPPPERCPHCGFVPPQFDAPVWRGIGDLPMPPRPGPVERPWEPDEIALYWRIQRIKEVLIYVLIAAFAVNLGIKLL